MGDGKGITPVVAMVLLLFMTVAVAGGAYAWFSGILTGTQEEAEEELNTQVELKDLSCSGNVVEASATNTGSASLTGTGVDAFLRTPDGDLVSSSSIPMEAVGFRSPGSVGTVSFALDSVMQTRDYRVEIEGESFSVSGRCQGSSDIVYGFEGRYSPAETTFQASVWDVEQNAHESHCGLNCDDWCGDLGIVDERDHEDGDGNECRPLNGTGMGYIRHSDTMTSQPIDLSGWSSGTLTFWWRGRSFDGDTQTATVEVYDGSSWQQLICMEDESGGNDVGCDEFDDMNWYKESIDISSYLNSDFRIRLQGSPGSWDDVWFDEMRITE